MQTTDAARTQALTAALVAELEAEAETTRAVLERVPEQHLSWAPHERSMTLGQLAMHIAGVPQGIAGLLREVVTEVPTVPLMAARSRAELLSTLATSVEVARDALRSWGDDGLRADWTMTSGGDPLIVRPRLEMVRSLMLNHWYHHRGQLTVYLRLLEVPVPPVYGPTADENPFAGA